MTLLGGQHHRLFHTLLLFLFFLIFFFSFSVIAAASGWKRLAAHPPPSARPGPRSISARPLSAVCKVRFIVILSSCNFPHSLSSLSHFSSSSRAPCSVVSFRVPSLKASVFRDDVQQPKRPFLMSLSAFCPKTAEQGSARHRRSCPLTSFPREGFS